MERGEREKESEYKWFQILLKDALRCMRKALAWWLLSEVDGRITKHILRIDWHAEHDGTQ